MNRTADMFPQLPIFHAEVIPQLIVVPSGIVNKPDRHNKPCLSCCLPNEKDTTTCGMPPYQGWFLAGLAAPAVELVDDEGLVV
jgi:hypothetical protein